MAYAFNPFTGEMDYYLGPADLGGDPFPVYTRTDGRAGIANDTTLTTTAAGTGTLYGASTTGGGLKLRANSANTTTGLIEIDRIASLYPSQGNIAADLAVLTYSPTCSMTASAVLTGFSFAPILTNTAGISTVRAFSIGGTYTVSGLVVLMAGLYAAPQIVSQSAVGGAGIFRLFEGSPAFNSSTVGATVPGPSMYFSGPQYGLTSGGSHGTIPQLNALEDQGVLQVSVASTSVTLTEWNTVRSEAFLKSLTGGGTPSTITLGTRRGVHVKDINSTATGTSVVTDNVGFDIENMVVGNSGSRTCTNVYGVRSFLAAGTKRWFLYGSGTADSVHTGNLRLGDVTAPTALLDLAGKMTVTAAGLVTKYNNDVAAGNGVAAVVASVANKTAQTASIGTTTLFTAPAAGLYQVCFYLVVTTAGTAGTVTATISWTDAAKAQTYTTNTVAMGVGSLGNYVTNVGGSVAPIANGMPFYVQVANAAVISYATTVAAAAGTPKYDFYATVLRVA